MKAKYTNRSLVRRRLISAAIAVASSLLMVGAAATAAHAAGEATAEKPAGQFRAGAYAVDITPQEFPVFVEGGFLERIAGRAQTPIHARCLVLDDGTTRVGVCVVDSCELPRELLDEAKQLARKATGIPSERIMISANHSHYMPAVVGALGTRVDEKYARFLPGRIAKGIEQAAENLRPARVGWAVVRDPEHTHCRRWIMRPDRVGTDLFGDRWTDRARMHPGYSNPRCVGPAGPADDAVTLLSLQTPDGRPIALLANYSMHYYGAQPVSDDYFGPFAEKFARLVGAEDADPPFVAVMSQGTSGDLQWMDYSRPRRKPGNLDAYAEAVARVAYEAYKTIEHHDRVPLAMAEKKLTLKRRVPDEQRLAWARKIIAEMKGPVPKNQRQVYALEQVYLHEDPVRELKLQAIRIGELGITAIPCEVYGITGLKLKAQSPLSPTMNIGLANGSEGYIPPPEQHKLGGYTTWEARGAGLEVQAEPKIVEAVLQLLEKVAGRPRRKVADTHGPYARAVLASKPAAYWRMGEFSGPRAADASRNNVHGTYEDGVVFYLEGPLSPGFCGPDQINRAAHFAGHFTDGRMKATVKKLGETYSVELWFWNGMPVDARAVTGYLFSRGAVTPDIPVDGVKEARGDHLGIGGHSGATGKLYFFNGNTQNEVLAGTTEIPLRTWNHVVLVRDGKRVTVYLNGNSAPEISGEAALTISPDVDRVFFGGRSASRSHGYFGSFAGKIDEAAIYRRVLSPDEVAAHHAAAGPP